MQRSKRAAREAKRGLAASCLWPLALAACGGSDAGPADDGGPPASYDNCEASQAVERLMVMSLEPENPVGFTNSDATPGAVLDPVPPAMTATPLPEPRCGESGNALHVVTSGLKLWGYSFGFNQMTALPGGQQTPAVEGVTDPTQFFDASDWDGISMWVRRGESSGSTIFASISERYTDPGGVNLFGADEQGLRATAWNPGAGGELVESLIGYCSFDAEDVDGDGQTEPLESQCDRFGVGVGLSLEWQFVKIPFDAMRQRAFGRPAPTSSPDRRILGFDFGLDGEVWDFWFDDLAFYRELAEEPAQ